MKLLRPTPDRWLRVKAITADALERPEAERSSFLAAACAGDETLLAEVESLLGADARAGEFLEAPGLAETGAAGAVVRAAEEGAPLLIAGRRLGPYRILEELGHGGMGVVYLAERADAAFEKQVAIKVVRGGFAGESLMRRFREERRILATLDHPNIARLLDGGTTDDGLPYLVMEYVDGIALDVYSQAARLSVGQRLELFRQVCAAVQYAHQRLVIHRDLKARNILVTPDGTPKLLDFGIAKLLEPGPEPEEQTRTGLRALTLEGASPEQVRGEPLTVTSDVYALGVLLYRLLTGQSPYGPARWTDAELMRAICEDTPERPSAVAPIEHRRELGGELDWITLKALRKEPDRRYPSVERLADDIQRHSSGRPVAAAPDSWSYRARKFAARNRTRVAAGALLALSLAAGVTTTLWQARRAEEQRARAERRFSDVRKVATSMMGEMQDAIEALPGATTARGLLLKRACERLDALALDAPDDPALAEEVATAYHRLGHVQGGSANTANLGDEAAGRASHRKGLALRKALAARFPDDLEARSRVVASLIDTGPSLEHAKEAVATAESLHAARPLETRFTRQVAAAQYALGSQYREIGDMPRALAAFESATPVYQAIYDANPRGAEANRALALCHKRLGAILAEMQSPRALGHLRSAVALDEATLSEQPNGPQERRDLSVSLIQLGIALQKAGDLKGALAPLRRAVVLREGLVRDDPDNARAPRDLAVALWSVGVLQNDMGHWADALASLDRAALLAKSLAATTRPTGTQDLRATIARALADSYEGSGRLSEALGFRKQALQGHRALFAGQPGMRGLRRDVAWDEKALGGTLARLDRWREAREAYEEGLKVAADLGPAPLDPGDAKLMDGLRDGLARVAARATAQR
jgi:tetratricopeptide (TPR) repeat protein